MEIADKVVELCLKRVLEAGFMVLKNNTVLTVEMKWVSVVYQEKSDKLLSYPFSMSDRIKISEAGFTVLTIIDGPRPKIKQIKLMGWGNFPCKEIFHNQNQAEAFLRELVQNDERALWL